MDESLYRSYWSCLHCLFLAGVDARWGNLGLFLRPELAHNLPADAWEQYSAEKEAALETLFTPPPPVDSLRRLEVECRFVVTQLEPIAKWQAWLADPKFRGLWRKEVPRHGYLADALIRELWAIMRRLDRRPPPPLPMFPCTADAAISTLERAIEWCWADVPTPENVGSGQENVPACEAKPDASGVTATNYTRKTQKAKWLAEAMLLIQEHPDWPDAKIAALVGKSPSTLSRSEKYQFAKKLAQGDKADRVRGRRVVDPDSGLADIESAAGDKADRGSSIVGSKYFREYCASCDEPIKVSRDQLSKNPLCEDCQK